LESKLLKETKKLREQAQINEDLQVRVIELQQQFDLLQKNSKKEEKNREQEEQQKQQFAEIIHLKKLLQDNNEQNQITEIKIQQYQLEVQKREEEMSHLKDRAARQLLGIEEKLRKESEMRKQKEEETEQIRKERGELEKMRKESENKLHVLTGGLGFEVYQKVNLQKNEKQQQQLEAECVVCMENDIECTTEPCMHKVLCESCYNSLKKKCCPVCNTPITNCRID